MIVTSLSFHKLNVWKKPTFSSIISNLYDTKGKTFLTQEEVRYLFSTFFQLMSGSNDNFDQDTLYSKEKLENILQLIFGDKTQISEADFERVCIENEDVQSLIGELHFFLFMSLASNAKRFEERRCSLIPRPLSMTSLV